MLKTLSFFKEHMGEHVVVESGETSTGWWRKWSDGFIEQGGTTTSGAWTNPPTLTFMKAFKDTNYKIVGTVIGKNDVLGLMVYFSNKTTNTVGVIGSNNGGGVQTREVDWYAMGY